MAWHTPDMRCASSLQLSIPHCACASIHPSMHSCIHASIAAHTPLSYLSKLILHQPPAPLCVICCCCCCACACACCCCCCLSLLPPHAILSDLLITPAHRCDARLIAIMHVDSLCLCLCLSPFTPHTLLLHLCVGSTRRCDMCLNVSMDARRGQGWRLSCVRELRMLGNRERTGLKRT